MNSTKNLIEPKLLMNPTKNLIEPKLYIIPTKNMIEPKHYMNATKNLKLLLLMVLISLLGNLELILVSNVLSKRLCLHLLISVRLRI
jgi:hypothetical protein